MPKDISNFLILMEMQGKYHRQASGLFTCKVTPSAVSLSRSHTDASASPALGTALPPSLHYVLQPHSSP